MYFTIKYSSNIYDINKFLGEDFEKKRKINFSSSWNSYNVYDSIIGILVKYKRGIDLGINNEMGKNFIIFTFVPINSMLVLPFLASSYKYFKQGRLKKQNFKNRIILLCVILIIVLILEFFLF